MTKNCILQVALILSIGVVAGCQETPTSSATYLGAETEALGSKGGTSLATGDVIITEADFEKYGLKRRSAAEVDSMVAAQNWNTVDASSTTLTTSGCNGCFWGTDIRLHGPSTSPDGQDGWFEVENWSDTSDWLHIDYVSIQSQVFAQDFCAGNSRLVNSDFRERFGGQWVPDHLTYQLWFNPAASPSYVEANGVFTFRDKNTGELHERIDFEGRCGQ